MKKLASSALILALAAVAATGCVIYPGTARETTWEELRREEGWILLDAVPFVPQESEQDCGAAALSTVLAHWGVAAPAAVLEKECAVEGEEGLRAAALRDAAKRRGLSAYLFAGRVDDLEHELKRGRPIVVGLLKTLGPAYATHFEVVVGIHPREGRVAALDPARGLVSDSLSGFSGEWAATKGVTLVVFRSAADTVSRAAGGP